MNYYMITKSKTRGAQPESPAPKKEHYSMLNATEMKTKNENLIHRKMCGQNIETSQEKENQARNKKNF